MAESERIKWLKVVRADADHGGYEGNVLHWIATHSSDVQSADLARRALEARERE